MTSLEETYKKFTLVFVKKKDAILLGLKLRGFGVGKWNGFGGKIEQDETIESAAVRELREECNLIVNKRDLHYLGYVTYKQDNEARIVYIFTAFKFEDVCRGSDEMMPRWFKFDDIPYGEMWPDSEYWLPLVLSNKRLQAHFYYGTNEEIVDMLVQEIKEPDALHVF